MSHLTSNILRTAVLLLALAATLAVADPARAGCLKEYGECGDCAAKAMASAIRNRDVFAAADAYVDAVDCDIDLLHCILYDSHHSYSCGI